MLQITKKEERLFPYGNGKYGGLSATWEARQVDGLLIAKRRVQPRTESNPNPPAAWLVYARQATPLYPDDQPASQLAQQVAAKLKGQRFENRRDALWAAETVLMQKKLPAQ